MKFFRNYILVVAGIFLVIFLLQKFNVFPSWGSLFSAKPVVIEETPVLISEIKELSEMITITAFDEVVVDSIKPSKYDIVNKITGFSVPTLSPTPDRLVLVSRGKVMAGTDLSALMPDDFYIDKDSVSMTLPPARIFDVITNPSDFTTFAESGEWTPEAVTLVKQKARNKVLQRALENGILEKANQRSKVVMENFLRSLGYSRIQIMMQ
ncbi:MAG: DUF4230 domain-containing protein [Sphingobacteriales bacterium]|jgi:hypothetical protein